MTLDSRFASREVRIIVACLLAALLSVAARRAHAGGLYLVPLGTEPAARAGARVAGVSSPHALWYNPAGLAYARRQLLVDVGVPLVRASFTRFVEDGSIDPRVTARSSVFPLPTVAYTDDFGLSRFGFGIGVVVPPAYALSWPSDLDGRPAPQRFSIVDTESSAVGSLAVAAAYRPHPRLSLGVALYLTAARVGGEAAISACDYAFCAQPEGREWEGRTRFLLGPIYTATATFGARYDFARVRLGGSLQLRTKLAGEAQFDVQLPDHFLFDDVTLTNARGGRDLRARMSLVLPMVARLGVEVDVTRTLAIELATSWEQWSQQGAIQVRPIGVIAHDVPGIGDVPVLPVSVARNTRDTWALHLGGTQALTQLMPRRRRLLLHLGAMLESSSLAARDLSPSSIDADKLLLAGGLSVELLTGVLLDLTYGHVFMRDHTVRNSRVRLPTAIRPAPVDATPDTWEPGEPPRIGNGRYAVEADYVALGLRWHVDETRPRKAHSQ